MRPSARDLSSVVVCAVVAQEEVDEPDQMRVEFQQPVQLFLALHHPDVVPLGMWHYIFRLPSDKFQILYNICASHDAQELWIY